MQGLCVGRQAREAEDTFDSLGSLPSTKRFRKGGLVVVEKHEKFDDKCVERDVCLLEDFFE